MDSWGQPAFRYFPCFVQYSEQIQIQYFGPARLVNTFDKRVLRRFAWLDKFSCMPCSSAHCARASDISFGPLSIRIFSWFAAMPSDPTHE